MTLLIDIGNARIKWARLTDGALQAQGGALHLDAFDDAFEQLAAALPPGANRVVVANVAGDKFAARLTQLIRTRYRFEPEFIAVEHERLGVRCGYANPARLGVDRWAAVIGAYRTVGAACVIGAGTAVTFDAVDAAGRHLGGLIFAGPRLAAAALERSTNGIGATPPAGARPAERQLLGTNTAAAVGNAALLAVAAGLDRAIAAVAAVFGAAPPVLVTGGDAAQIASWLETVTQLRADLVLEGLALLVDEPREG
jgi:type III pantothenate kinase